MEKNITLKNEDINFVSVLVIDENGEKLGIMTSDAANNIAYERGLDLVLVAGNSKIPVCKIMDYNKFKFDQNKKAKQAKKNQKEIVVKEIQLSLNIDKHDLDTKINKTRKFLMSGNRVNVVLRLRGRENTFVNRGMDLAQSFYDACSDIAKLSKPIKYEGNDIFFLILPN